MNEAEVRQTLAAHGLPSDMQLRVESDQHFAGRYFFARDELHLQPNCDHFTLLHEGAHAEHWGKLGMRGSLGTPSLEFLAGALLVSEVYVGRRLASESGYHKHEWALLKAIPGFPDRFVDLADMFDTLQAFGPPSEQRLLRLESMKFLFRTLPLLGIETSSGSLCFFKNMQRSQTLPGLMCSFAIALNEFGNASLIDLGTIEKFGNDVLVDLRNAGLTISAAV
jgi:hypothetical protein